MISFISKENNQIIKASLEKFLNDGGNIKEYFDATNQEEKIFSIKLSEPYFDCYDILIPFKGGLNFSSSDNRGMPREEFIALVEETTGWEFRGSQGDNKLIMEFAIMENIDDDTAFDILKESQQT